jgi:SAM-dependent methyltransferase
VLDIGGGPGRYSLWLARNGCDVTLFDLSEQNVEFARRKAAQYGVNITAMAGDARYISANPKLYKKYDHVFLMGPLYHLVDEADRISAVKGAMSRLNRGGKLFASFISQTGGMVFMLREVPELVTLPTIKPLIDALIAGESIGGDGFTRAYYTYPDSILPFMAQFPLKKLHLLAQEGVSAPFVHKLAQLPRDAFDEWIRINLAVCEKKEFLAFAEHLMYIGEKNS